MDNLLTHDQILNNKFTDKWDNEIYQFQPRLDLFKSYYIQFDPNDEYYEVNILTEICQELKSAISHRLNRINEEIDDTIDDVFEGDKINDITNFDDIDVITQTRQLIDNFNDDEWEFEYLWMDYDLMGQMWGTFKNLVTITKMIQEYYEDDVGEIWSNDLGDLGGWMGIGEFSDMSNWESDDESDDEYDDQD